MATPAKRRSPHDLLGVILAELSDQELDRAYAAAACSGQTLSQYAWHLMLEFKAQRARPPAVPDPDIQTSAYAAR